MWIEEGIKVNLETFKEPLLQLMYCNILWFQGIIQAALSERPLPQKKKKKIHLCFLGKPSFIVYMENLYGCQHI